MKVYYSVDGFASLIDITCYVKWDTLSIRIRGMSDDNHMAQNEASFKVIYDSALYASLMALTGYTGLYIENDDLTPAFRGEFPVPRSRSLDGIPTNTMLDIKATDHSRLLKKKVGDINFTNYRVMDPANKAASLVHVLCRQASSYFTPDSAFSDLMIYDQIPDFTPSDPNEEILAVLNTLCFEYGYSFGFDEDGKISPKKWKSVGGIKSTDLVAGSNVAITGPIVTKSAGGAHWNAGAYSSISFSSTARSIVRPNQINQSFMFGLNADPSTNDNYTSIDFAMYPAADGFLYIYESGVQVGSSYGAYTSEDRLSVYYRGTTVFYAKNDVVFHTTTTSAGRTFYWDSSLYEVGASFEVIAWESLTEISSCDLLSEVSIEHAPSEYDGAEVAYYEIGEAQGSEYDGRILIYQDSNCPPFDGTQWPGVSIPANTLYPFAANIDDDTQTVAKNRVYQDYSDAGITYFTNYAVKNNMQNNVFTKAFASDFSDIIKTYDHFIEWKSETQEQGINDPSGVSLLATHPDYPDDPDLPYQPTSWPVFLNKKARILFKNLNLSSAKLLQYFNVWARVVYKSNRRTVTIKNETEANNLFKYESIYILPRLATQQTALPLYNPAKELAEALSNQYKVGGNRYTLFSRNKYEIGSKPTLYIQSDNNLTQKVMIKSRYWDERAKRYEYSASAYSTEKRYIDLATFAMSSLAQASNRGDNVVPTLTNSVGVLPSLEDGSGTVLLPNGETTLQLFIAGIQDAETNWTYGWSCSSGLTGQMGSVAIGASGTGSASATFTLKSISNSTDSGSITITATPKSTGPRAGLSPLSIVFGIVKNKQGITGDALVQRYLSVSAAAIKRDLVPEAYTPGNLFVESYSKTGNDVAVLVPGVFKFYLNGSGTPIVTTSDVNSYTYPSTGTFPTDTSQVRVELYSADGLTLLDYQIIPVANSTDDIRLEITGGTAGVQYDAAGVNPTTIAAFSAVLKKNGTTVTPASYAWSVPNSLVTMLVAGSPSNASTYAPTAQASFDAGKADNRVFLSVTYGGATYTQEAVIAFTKVGSTGATGATGNSGVLPDTTALGLALTYEDVPDCPDGRGAFAGDEFIATGGTWSGGVFAKTAATGWGNARLRSKTALGNGACSTLIPSGASARIVGLNSDPDEGSGHTYIEYAIFTDSDGTLYRRYNGNSLAVGTYTTGDNLSIKYQNGSIFILKNGNDLWSQFVGYDKLFYFDSDWYNTAASGSLTFDGGTAYRSNFASTDGWTSIGSGSVTVNSGTLVISGNNYAQASPLKPIKANTLLVVQARQTVGSLGSLKIDTIGETLTLGALSQEWKTYTTITTGSALQNLYRSNYISEAGTLEIRLISASDGSYASPVVDVSPSRFKLANLGAVAVPGVVGKAVRFNGVNSRITCQTTALDMINGQAFSLHVWIKPQRNAGQYQIICQNRSMDAAIINWALFQNITDGALSFHGPGQYNTTSVPALNQWTAVAVAVSTAGRLRLWANSTLIYDQEGYTYGAPQGHLQIGANYTGTQAFLGDIDETLLWPNHELSDQEVVALYSNKTMPSIQSAIAQLLGATTAPRYRGFGYIADISGRTSSVFTEQHIEANILYTTASYAANIGDWVYNRVTGTYISKAIYQWSGTSWDINTELGKKQAANEDLLRLLKSGETTPLGTTYVESLVVNDAYVKALQTQEVQFEKSVSAIDKGIDGVLSQGDIGIYMGKDPRKPTDASRIYEFAFKEFLANGPTAETEEWMAHLLTRYLRSAAGYATLSLLLSGCIQATGGSLAPPAYTGMYGVKEVTLPNPYPASNSFVWNMGLGNGFSLLELGTNAATTKYRSTDGGATWATVTLSTIPTGMYMASDGSSIWSVNTSNQVVKTTDGLSFSAIANQPTGFTVAGVGYTNGLLFVVNSTRSSFQYSLDAGTTWSSVKSYYETVASNSLNYGNGVICTANNVSSFIRVSRDMGNTWASIATAAPPVRVRYGNGVWVAMGTNSLLRSVDGALSFAAVSSFPGTGSTDLLDCRYADGVWTFCGNIYNSGTEHQIYFSYDNMQTFKKVTPFDMAVGTTSVRSLQLCLYSVIYKRFFYVGYAQESSGLLTPQLYMADWQVTGIVDSGRNANGSWRIMGDNSLEMWGLISITGSGDVTFPLPGVSLKNEVSDIQVSTAGTTAVATSYRYLSSTSTLTLYVAGGGTHTLSWHLWGRRA